MPGDERTTIQLQGVYNTLYSARTRPDFKFTVTRYFIDEWVPLLGPSLAWLVVGLRQQCYWNRRRDWCVVDKATLSDETALDERTIERCLKKPYSRWFVVEVSHRYRYLHHLGKKVRDKNRYQLLLDEPLSPRHQLGLVTLLHKKRPDIAGHPLDAALATVQVIREMPDLPGKITHTGPIPKNLPRRTVLELVEDALDFNLADYAEDERTVQLDQFCTELYNRITQPNKVYVGWQYFRMEWVRLLGHALAWLVIYLRRHCFWDEKSGELRDTHVTYKKDLARAIGQTTRNLANLMDNPYTALFFSVGQTPEASDTPDGRPKTTRNQPTLYRVRLIDEPLTPTDQQQIANELRLRLQGEFYGQNPENGQLNLFPILKQLSNRQDFAYGQLSARVPVSEGKESRLELELPEKMPYQAAGETGKNAATIEDSLILQESEIIQQQTAQLSDAAPKGLQMILQDLGIEEPARSKLLANPDLTVAKVGAWFLYAETQPGLKEPQSYVIKRLLDNDPPPPEFLAFAMLDDQTWELFEETARALRLGEELPGMISSRQVDTFIKWANIYGGLEPAETRYLLSASHRAREKRREDMGEAAKPLSVDDPRHQDAHRLWQAALDQLQQQMARQTFDTWLKPTEVLDYQDDTFIIDAKSAFAKDWLENRLARSIERMLSLVVGKPTSVRFALTRSEQSR